MNQHCARQYHNIKIQISPEDMVKLKMLRNNINRSKLHSTKNKE
jgi:hypothetical protein